MSPAPVPAEHIPDAIARTPHRRRAAAPGGAADDQILEKYLKLIDEEATPGDAQ